jgi:lysozyme family protein
MTKTFTDALAIVLREEGGWADDPQDPGGMTNLGVTARTWQQWTGKAPTEATMRALTPAQVGPLYRAWYWDKVTGDQLPVGLALGLLDFAVNAGPPRAVKLLQGVCGASVDGGIGPGTQRALQAYITGIGLAKLIVRFCDARREYYRARPTFDHFGKGWLARVDRVEKEALSWVG